MEAVMEVETQPKYRQRYKRGSGMANPDYPNQNFGEIEDEYWKPVVLHGEAVPKYIVSNYGNIIGPSGFKLKWISRQGYPMVTMYLPHNPFAGHYYRENASGNIQTKVNPHILVATAFLPLDDNIPKELDEYIEIDGQPKHLWSLLPEKTKLWLRSLLHVDHIDGDKGNCHVSNLTFVSSRENQEHVKKQRLESSS